LSSISSSTPSSAICLSSHIRTPFPSARPSALRTIGYLAVSRYFLASSADVNVSYAAVGILYFFIRSLENAFEPSSIAAFFLGPNTLKPSASNASTIPPTSGSSIPITVRSIAFSLANATSLSNSIALISTHSATSAIPALPGAQYILSTLGLWLIFQHMACSRPPLPTTKTFICSSSNII